MIVREMGGEGPPASKSYLVELKDVVAMVFPGQTVEAEEESEENERAGDS